MKYCAKRAVDSAAHNKPVLKMQKYDKEKRLELVCIGYNKLLSDSCLKHERLMHGFIIPAHLNVVTMLLPDLYYFYFMYPSFEQKKASFGLAGIKYIFIANNKYKFICIVCCVSLRSSF